MPSRRHQRSPPRQGRNATTEPSWLEVEPEREHDSQRSFLVVPPVLMRRQHFVDPRTSETKEVLRPAGRQGVDSILASSRPTRSGGLPLQRVLSSSQDFYACIDSSSSYWESQLSSEDAAVIRMTGTSYGNLTYNGDTVSHPSMYMAPAWWSESASTSLEDASSFTAVTHEGPSAHDSGDGGNEESPAPARSVWQSCLPAVGLMILTSLLLGTAVTTVLPDERHTAGAGRATFRSAHNHGALEGDSGLVVGAGKSSFESAPAVRVRRRGERRSHNLRRASMTKPVDATSPPANIKTNSVDCQEPFHTYCTGSNAEYFYSSLADTCMLASENLVQLCNRGRNKFSSKRRCETRCVLAEPPHHNCLEKPLFAACRRQDHLVTIHILGYMKGQHE
ncbi:hypothetical protein MTO96_016264 [Rhipicephalus appendiculatus]